MNSIYRSIWNDKTGTFVATSEIATCHGKKSSPGASSLAQGACFALKGLVVSLMLAFGSNSYALPTGGAVAAGSASIASSTGTMTINQASQNAAINWQSFNIGQTEAVRFVQPNSSSVALNRVLGADPSSILGSLSANGKVFLVNPNGMLFGKGASVNVGGLVASTLNITDGDFMAGTYKFSGAGSGTILNQGSINADGGFVALLGANISNQGVISARLGSIALAAGNAMTLDIAGDGLLNVTVNQGAVNALVQNGGLIQADGGQVLLTAQAAGSLLQSAVNNTGVIQAQTIANHNGTIRLIGDMQSGTVNLGGTLDASGKDAGQTGGDVLATGHHVGIVDKAKIDASGDAGGGNVLIGGDYQGKNPNIQNASATYMSADSAINADAITNGNGGKVVLWANDTTRAYGSIAARGGAQAGDGGLIETSGRYLDVAGINANASAPNGKGGSWLLDPNNISINSGAGPGGDTNVTASPNFTSTDDTAIVLNGNIQTALNAGTSVVITTGTGGANLQAGNITVASTLAWNHASAPTLTLTALGDVIINSTITATTGSFAANAGGNITISAATGATTGNLTFTAGGDITIAAATKTTTGNLTFTAGNDVKINQALTVTTGNITAKAKHDVIVPSGSAISLDTGEMVLQADNDGTGPGVGGGTVTIGCAAGCITQTVGGHSLSIRFNPVSYSTTAAEIAAYIPKLTGAATLDAKAWVFGQGVNKTYDATTAATITFKGTPSNGGTVTLVPGTALFDTAAVGTGKTVTYNGYTLGGADAGRFALFGVDPRTTTANIDPAILYLSVFATSKTKIYGDTAVLTAFTSSGLQGSETIGSVTLTSPGTPAAASVGSYTITASNATGGTFIPSNYSISYVNGVLGVLRAPLGVTANSSIKTFGSMVNFTGSEFSSTGLKNGEAIGSVSLASAGAVSTANVAGSPYAITASTATGGTFNPSNYTISYVDGSLGVIASGLGIAANPAVKIYDGLGYTGGNGVVYTGFQGSDTPASLGGTLTYGGSSQGAINVGNYAIVPSGQTSSNYTITYVPSNLGIIQAPLGIAANSGSKTYGSTASFAGSEFSSHGLQNGETVGSVSLASAGAAATANVATYAITPSAATGGSFTPANYAISYVDGALAVIPAPLNILANTATRIYGAANPTFSATYSNFQNGETPASLTGTLAFATPAVATSDVGRYAITPSGQSSTNYTISYFVGPLDVTPAPMVVTASNVSKPYGQTPTLTAFTTAGLANGDTVGSVTETSPGTPATASVLGSPYAIIPSAATGGTFKPTNYTVSYVNGLLTVTPVALTVTAGNVSKSYGQTPTLTAFTTAGLVNGETVGSVTETSPGTPPTAGVAGSPYAITPSAATGGTFTPSNYTVSYINGLLTVTPVGLLVTADDALKTFGQTPTLTAFTTTGLLNGETVGSVTETSPGTAADASVLGSPYPITPSNATGGTFTPSNYTITYGNGELTVIPLIATVPVTVPPQPSAVAPPWLPAVVLAETPAQLLTVVPAAVPTKTRAIVPEPAPVAEPAQEAPKLYVAPLHPRKPDRN